MKQNNRWNNIFIYVAIALILIAFLPILYIARYAHPVADDWDYSWNIRQMVDGLSGVGKILAFILAPIKALGVSLIFWFSWQGLYSSATVLALEPGIWGEDAYFLGVIIIIATYWFGIYFILKTIIVDFLKLRKCYAVYSSLLLAYYISNAMPSPNQGLYWFNGAANYMVFFGVMMFELAFIMKAYNDGNKRNVIILSCSAFILSGGNHISAFAGILMLIVFLGLQFLSGKKRCYVPLVVAVLGFALNILSPGTFARNATLDNVDRSFVGTILVCSLESVRLAKRFFGVGFWLMLLLLLPIIVIVVRSTDSKLFQWKYFAGILVVDYGILSAMLCVPQYALGTLGEPRVYDLLFAAYTVFGVLTFGYFIGCIFNMIHFYEKFNIDNLFWITYLTTFIAVFAMIVYAGGRNGLGTSLKAIDEVFITKTAIEYDYEMDLRVKMASDNQDTDITFLPINTKSELLFLGDLSDNPDFYANVSFSRFYGVNSVRIIEE